MQSDMKKEIESTEDIKVLVDSFYSRVREDDMLAPVFNSVINDSWPSHLEKMYRFWGTVLLEEGSYSGSPFLRHAGLPVDKGHFERWISLFTRTVGEMFSGPNAEKAIWQANRMATMFQVKMEYYRNNPRQPLI